MTRLEKLEYQGTHVFWPVLMPYVGLKVRLDCGHYLTIRPGCFLVNDFVIRQGSRRIVCAPCAYEGM